MRVINGPTSQKNKNEVQTRRLTNRANLNGLRSKNETKKILYKTVNVNPRESEIATSE